MNTVLIRSTFLSVVGPALMALTVLMLSGCSEGGIGGTGGTALPFAPTSSTVGGQANKGPFEKGSEVSVAALQNDGKVSAEIGHTSTGGLGSFQLDIDETPLIQVSVNGRYFSENLAAAIKEEVRLTGLGVPGNTFNVNVATHLITPRIKQLMSEGITFDAAEDMATGELLLALNRVLFAPVNLLRAGNLVLINAVDGSVNPEGNAWLLTLSSLLDSVALTHSTLDNETPGAAMQSVLDRIAADLANDGVLDDGADRELIAARRLINPDRIHSALLVLANDLVSARLVDSGLSLEAASAFECQADAAELTCLKSGLSAGGSAPGR